MKLETAKTKEPVMLEASAQVLLEFKAKNGSLTPKSAHFLTEEGVLNRYLFDGKTMDEVRAG